MSETALGNAMVHKTVPQRTVKDGAAANCLSFGVAPLIVPAATIMSKRARERERERVRVFVRVRVCVCVCACVRVRVRACVPDWLTVCGVRAATTDKRRETRGQSVKQNDTPSV